MALPIGDPYSSPLAETGRGVRQRTPPVLYVLVFLGVLQLGAFGLLIDVTSRLEPTGPSKAPEPTYVPLPRAVTNELLITLARDFTAGYNEGRDDDLIAPMSPLVKLQLGREGMLRALSTMREKFGKIDRAAYIYHDFDAKDRSIDLHWQVRVEKPDTDGDRSGMLVLSLVDLGDRVEVSGFSLKFASLRDAELAKP